MEGYHETATPSATDPLAIGSEKRLSRERFCRPPRKYESVVMLPVGRVLQAIQEHCSSGGTIKPGVRQLATWSGCSQGSISKHLYQLEADGWIRYDGPSGCITLCVDPDQLIPETQRSWTGVVGGIYLLKCGDAYKIGCSADVKRRIASLSLPYKELICVIPSGDMYGDEAAVHALFRAKQLNHEWFALDDADVAWFKEHLASSSLITQPDDSDQSADRDQADDQEAADQDSDRSDDPPDQVADRPQPLPDQSIDRDRSADRSETISPLIGAVRRVLTRQEETDHRADRSAPHMVDHVLVAAAEDHDSAAATREKLPCAAPIDQAVDRSPTALLLAELGCDDAALRAEILANHPDLTPAQLGEQWALAQERERDGYTGNPRRLLFGTLRKGGWLYGRTVDRDRPIAAADLPPPPEPDEQAFNAAYRRARSLAPPGLAHTAMTELIYALLDGASDDQALDLIAAACPGAAGGGAP